MFESAMDGIDRPNRPIHDRIVWHAKLISLMRNIVPRVGEAVPSSGMEPAMSRPHSRAASTSLALNTIRCSISSQSDRVWTYDETILRVELVKNRADLITT